MVLGCHSTSFLGGAKSFINCLSKETSESNLGSSFVIYYQARPEPVGVFFGAFSAHQSLQKAPWGVPGKPRKPKACAC